MPFMICARSLLKWINGLILGYLSIGIFLFVNSKMK